MNIEVSNNLKNAIDKSIKDFKATLFIEDLNLNVVDNDYNIKEIELDI